MPQFMGHHLNRLDAKGRVSIPAPFRAALRPAGAPSTPAPVALILRPSHVHACIEGWSPGEFAKLGAPLQSLDLFSEAHDDMATALYSDAAQVESDREGRIVLPETLAAYAGVTDSVEFMGVGRYFQIWEPQAAEQRRAAAKERARTRGFTVPGTQPLAGTPPA